MKKEYPKVSVWLIPQEADSKKLQKTIKRLAGMFRVPSFDPHLTMYSTTGFVSDVDSVRFELSKIAGDFQPIVLETGGIHFKQELFQAIIIHLGLTLELKKLYNRVENILLPFGKYTLNPHLSLLYHSDLPEGNKRSASSGIEIPAEITFDRLAFVVHNSEKDRLDFGNWTFATL